MIDPGHGRLGIARQCSLVSISRSSFYYQGKGESPLNLSLMRLIDEQFLATPWYGSRQMARHLRRLGYGVGRKRVRRLMRLMGCRSESSRGEILDIPSKIVPVQSDTIDRKNKSRPRAIRKTQ